MKTNIAKLPWRTEEEQLDSWKSGFSMITVTRCRDFVRDTMGLCLSCCPQESGDDSQGPDGDRSRLINGEVLPGGRENSGSWNHLGNEFDNDNLPNGSLEDSHIGRDYAECDYLSNPLWAFGRSKCTLQNFNFQVKWVKFEAKLDIYFR